MMVRNSHTSLAHARPGQLLEVRGIRFDMVRDRCSEAGIEPGSVFTCTENRNGSVVILLADGTSKVLERHYAWFVQTAAPPLRSLTHQRR